jgi:hypothetical protein
VNDQREAELVLTSVNQKGEKLMFTKRLFLILLLTAAMATIASAQSKRGWGNKVVRRGNAPTANANAHQGEPGDKNALEGTWRATETFDPESIFKVLFTFSAGRDANSGTAIHSDELYLTGGPSCLPSQGVWKRAGDRDFIATDEGFCFDPFNVFAPAGKIKFKSAITLNSQGTAFDGTMHVEAFDVEGGLVFMADAALHGERMRAEAPTP